MLELLSFYENCDMKTEIFKFKLCKLYSKFNFLILRLANGGKINIGK